MGGAGGREGWGVESDIAIAGGRCFVSTLFADDDCGPSEESVGLSLRMLVLRPRDAKKPVPTPFEPGRGRSDFVGDRRRVEERTGERCTCACAREGYGRIGGGELLDAISLGRVDRSVAVYASARMGNVASDAREP